MANEKRRHEKTVKDLMVQVRGKLETSDIGSWVYSPITKYSILIPAKSALFGFLFQFSAVLNIVRLRQPESSAFGFFSCIWVMCVRMTIRNIASFKPLLIRYPHARAPCYQYRAWLSASPACSSRIREATNRAQNSTRGCGGSQESSVQTSRKVGIQICLKFGPTSLNHCLHTVFGTAPFFSDTVTSHLLSLIISQFN